GAFAYRKPTADERAAGGPRRARRVEPFPEVVLARPPASSSPRPPSPAVGRAQPPARERKTELDPATYLQRGSERVQAGDLDGAIAELRRCIFLAPDLVGARFLLATVFQRAGRLADAHREYRAVATSLRGRDPSAAVPGT